MQTDLKRLFSANIHTALVTRKTKWEEVDFTLLSSRSPSPSFSETHFGEKRILHATATKLSFTEFQLNLINRIRKLAESRNLTLEIKNDVSDMKHVKLILVRKE